MVLPKKRKTVRRRKLVTQDVDHLAWTQYVNTGSMKNIALVAAAVAAVIYLNSTVFVPMYESGPLPVPARAEVDKLRTDTQQGLAETNKGLSETLEVAKAARQEAQQAVQESRDARMTRLLQQKLDLEQRLKLTPNDNILNDLYARTNADIVRLTAMPPQQQPGVIK